MNLRITCSQDPHGVFQVVCTKFRAHTEFQAPQYIADQVQTWHRETRERRGDLDELVLVVLDGVVGEEEPDAVDGVALLLARARPQDDRDRDHPLVQQLRPLDHQEVDHVLAPCVWRERVGPGEAGQPQQPRLALLACPLLREQHAARALRGCALRAVCARLQRLRRPPQLPLPSCLLRLPQHAPPEAAAPPNPSSAPSARGGGQRGRGTNQRSARAWSWRSPMLVTPMMWFSFVTICSMTSANPSHLPPTHPGSAPPRVPQRSARQLHDHNGGVAAVQEKEAMLRRMAGMESKAGRGARDDAVLVDGKLIQEVLHVVLCPLDPDAAQVLSEVRSRERNAAIPPARLVVHVADAVEAQALVVVALRARAACESAHCHLTAPSATRLHTPALRQC
eukprot:1397456-Rhodomonas_salina.4